MATKKISELQEIQEIASNDLFVVVDTSEGDTNKITKENALSGLQTKITSTNKIASDNVDDTESTNKFVTTSDITNWNNKISTETDPVFTASAAHGISASDITNWDSKQDQLTAGTGITIDANNVISSSTDDIKIFDFRYDNRTTETEKAKLKEIAEAYDNNKKIIVKVTNGDGYMFTPVIANVTKIGLNYHLTFDFMKSEPASGHGIYGTIYKKCIKVDIPYQVNGSTVTIGTIDSHEFYVNDTATRSALPLASGNTESYTPSGDYNPATKKYVDDSVSTKQDLLVSGTNIKTINNTSLLGSGDITISGGDTTKVFTLSYINLSSQIADLKEMADLYDAGKDFVVIVYYNTTSEGQTIARVTGNSSTRNYNIRGNNLLTYSGNYSFYGGSYKRFMNFNIPFSVSGDTATIGTKDYNYYQVLRYSDSSSDSLYPLATGNTTSYTPTSSYNPATKKYVDDNINTRQATLVSGTNIKTINGNSVLGSGDLVISGGGSDFTEITSSVTTYGSTFTEGESKWYKITTGSLSINLNPSGSKTFSAGSLVLCSKYLTTDGYIAFTIIDDTGVYNYEYLGSSVSSRSKFDDKSPLSQESLGNSIRILDSISSPTNWASLFEAPITIATRDITIEYQDTSTSLTETFIFPANTIIVGTLNGLMMRNSPIIIYLPDGQKYQVTNATVASLHMELLNDAILTILETNSNMEHKTNDNLPFMSPYKCDKELVACLPLYYQGQNSTDIVSLNDILNHFITPFINIPRDPNDQLIVDNTVDPNIFADANYISITPSNDGITFNNQNSENFFIEINYADVLGNNSVVNTGMMRGDLDINANLIFMASQMTLNFDTTLKSRMFEYIGGGTRETYEGIANHWEVNNYITPAEVYIGPDEMIFDITLSSNYNDSNTLNNYQNNAYLKVLNFGNSIVPGEFERRCYIKIWRIK